MYPADEEIKNQDEASQNDIAGIVSKDLRPGQAQVTDKAGGPSCPSSKREHGENGLIFSSLRASTSTTRPQPEKGLLTSRVES